MKNIATMLNYLVPILFIFCINHVRCQTDLCNFATCGECISYELERCVWCSKDVFDDRRCRPLSFTKTSDSWCKDGMINPNTTSTVVTSENFNNIVQLKPQLIKMKARPGIEINFNMSFKPAKDYPLDVYFLMDVSASMREKIADLRAQANKIYKDLTAYTINVRLGIGSIGSFVDKPSQTTHFVPNRHEGHAFKNEVSLTKDVEKFKSKIDNIIFGSNFDDPEAGLDALMQAMICAKEVGWRPEARRIIVLCTDSTYQVRDRKIISAIKPNDMKCHLENNIYSEALTYDYPSVSQINRAVSDGNFGIIFAVTNNTMDEYKELADQIVGATHAQLDEESVIDIIKTVYEEQANSAEMKYQAPPFVEVNIHQSCKSNPKINCESPHKHDVNISATLKVKSCPPDGARNQTYDVIVNPLGLPDKLTIQLQVDCQCDCEKEEGPIIPGICNGAGFMQCGICKCQPGSYGVDCRCNGSSTDQTHMEKCKMHANDTKCSGKGQCRCGICSCNTGFSGKFCEFDDQACPRPNARLCSGHGVCRLGQCHCDSQWDGMACGCPKSKEACIAPYSKKECSGRGRCVCGVCQCEKIEGKNETYSGAYCDNCEDCPGQRCKEFEKYAYCNYLHMNDKAACDKENEEVTSGKTSEIDIFFVNKTEINGPKLFMAKWCKKDMDNGTYMVFKYQYENNRLKITIQKELETPPKANIYSDQENIKPASNNDTFEQCGQSWDVDEGKNLSPPNKKMKDCSSQTEQDVAEVSHKTEISNEAFGLFVGRELATVPPIKRRFVMYEIIKIFEHCSK